MLYKRGLCRHAVSVYVCVCVCVSVCLSRSWVMSKRINISSNFFHHRVVTDGNPLNGGVECRWSRQKSRFWAYIWLRCLLLRLQQAVVNTVAGGPRPPPRRILWHIAGSKRRCWLARSINVTLKDNRTAHLTARSNKSVAYVTNNKRLLEVLYCWS